MPCAPEQQETPGISKSSLKVLCLHCIPGMRSGELLGLTWDCVDFDCGVIYVKKQLLQSRKKEDGFRFGTPKNGKGRVIMPAHFLMKMLKRHKTVQASRKLALGPA